jgi:hypothetical protein
MLQCSVVLRSTTEWSRLFLMKSAAVMDQDKRQSQGKVNLARIQVQRARRDANDLALAEDPASAMRRRMSSPFVPEETAPHADDPAEDVETSDSEDVYEESPASSQVDGDNVEMDEEEAPQLARSVRSTACHAFHFSFSSISHCYLFSELSLQRAPRNSQKQKKDAIRSAVLSEIDAIRQAEDWLDDYIPDMYVHLKFTCACLND